MWLETVLLIEAAAAFWLSALNVLLLWRVLSRARSRGRAAAAAALTCVCGAQSLEALLFLWLGEASEGDSWSAAAMLAVRTALAVSTALISLLLLRGLWQRR